MSEAPAAVSVSLEDRVRLLTGETSWTTYAIPALGLEAMTVSDGPIGVRGTDLIDPDPSAQLPAPSAVAATWDLELVGRLGRLLAREARRKGVDVVLAPVVNLQRTPVGGRHFEAYSEDPFYTGEVMAAFVTAVQGEGVGVCVKHYVANESETDRTSYVARLDERTLREAYLAPFEVAVKRVGAWSIMSAYNRVDDGVQSAPATEHGHLLIDVLKREWGFDGVVISDWLATNSTAPSANGGLDLVMPGPGGPWEARLLDAVEAGEVAESVIDDKVERLVRLAGRVGRLGGGEAAAAKAAVDPGLPAAASTCELLTEAVARSMVVLSNRGGILPLAGDRARRVALIGPNAVEPFVQGGGSAFVRAPYLSLPADALRAALPDASLTVHRGVNGRRFAPLIDPALVTTPTGAAGYELQYLDTALAPLGEPLVLPTTEGWNRDSPAAARSARLRFVVTLSTPGRHRVELGLAGAHRAYVDGELVGESDRIVGTDAILDSSANQPDGPAVEIELGVGESARLVVEIETQVIDAMAYGRIVRLELRHEPDAADPAAELAEAVAAAAAADLAIVVVGTNEETESEGWDRPTLALPPGEDELVERVLATGTPVVAIVNAGAPVVLPWLERVDAALWWWLPGQEAGNGLAQALTGAIEPSGRLPWTLPANEADVPVPNALPVDGVVAYSEGVHVGHRGWARLGRTPARPFGFGLGLGSWSISSVAVEGLTADAVDVSVTVAASGERATRAVVQLYLSALGDTLDRPVFWFAGFQAVELAPGDTRELALSIPRRLFEVWDVETHDWTLPAGPYRLRAAADALDEGVSIDIEGPAAY